MLKDPEKRVAYDRLGANFKAGQEFQSPPDWAEREGNARGYSQGFDGGDGQDHSAFA